MRPISNKFILSRKNQKGQVAIFVALIFQVIFVLFALMINIGLLVHQKINLQHSTDLAAYYSAMKQAESLNAIAHINYQMRQVWKLLAWRYRIFGSSGIVAETGNGSSQNPGDAEAPMFPFRGLGMEYQGDSIASGDSHKCNVNGVRVGLEDVPYICPGHAGLQDWPGTTENHCKVACKYLAGTTRPIQHISLTQGQNIFGEGYAVSLDSGINAVNNNLTSLCKSLSKFSVELLGNFLINYATEFKPRQATIEMLARNMSALPNEMVDLDGNKVFDGALRTLKNNLTEANFTGFKDAEFALYNSLSPENNCSFVAGKSAENTIEFLKRVDFRLLNYFIGKCDAVAGQSNRYDIEPLYLAGALNPLFTTGDFAVDPGAKAAIENLVFDSKNYHTIGFEKNPDCIVYSGVKSSAEPLIPFLPLKKIKLNAISFAKPFGGSIGPSFGKRWPFNNPISEINNNQQITAHVDGVLPIREVDGQPTSVAGGFVENKGRIINFSKYVGDQKGLADTKYMGTYHAILNTRDISTNSAPNIINTTDLLGPSNQSPRNEWPAIRNYSHFSQPTALKDYNTLSVKLLREVEISVVSPNQFDIAYYSIEPDFYYNYFERLSNPDIFNKIKTAGGGILGPATAEDVRPDIGAIITRDELTDKGSKLSTFNTEAGKDFSVRDQINIARDFFNHTPSIRGFSGKFLDRMNYMVSRQASLLTGWTFKKFNDYNIFPGPGNGVDYTENTMTFGTCKDPWNAHDDANNQGRPKDENDSLPPTSGNCVTGGRTGYSVKLISPEIIRNGNSFQPLLNPVSDSFLNFQ